MVKSSLGSAVRIEFSPRPGAALAGAEQGVDRGLAADVAQLVGIDPLGQRLAIGDGICLVDQHAQPLGGMLAGLVEPAFATAELPRDLADDSQGFAVQPGNGLVEAGADARWRAAIGGDGEILVAEPRLREMLFVGEGRQDIRSSANSLGSVPIASSSITSSWKWLR